MSPTEIVRILKGRNSEVFATLNVSTVRGWIDKSGPTPRWSDTCMAMAKRNNLQGGFGGRLGVLVSIVKHHTTERLLTI